MFSADRVELLKNCYSIIKTMDQSNLDLGKADF